MDNSNEKKLKGSQYFKEVIKKHLDKYSEEDKLFKKAYLKEHKSLDECIDFIIQKVQESGAHGFPDEEIYQMARHYYDEDDLDVKKPLTNVEILVNHQVSLTEEEIKEAKKTAIDRLIWEEKGKFSKKKNINKNVNVKQEKLF